MTQNRHLRTIAKLYRPMSSQLRHVSTIGEKLVKNSNIFPMSPQYCELRPTKGWDRLASLGHPCKFQRVSRLGSIVTAATSLTGGQPNCTMFGRLLGWYCTFSGALAPCGILPGTKFTLHPSRSFSYIGSVTARHSSSGNQPNFAAWYSEWKYGTFAEGACTSIRQGGHHVGHRPTF